MKHIFLFISLYSLVSSVLFSVYILTQERNFRLGYGTIYTQILLPDFVDVMPCVLVHFVPALQYNVTVVITDIFPSKTQKSHISQPCGNHNYRSLAKYQAFCLGIVLGFVLLKF